MSRQASPPRLDLKRPDTIERAISSVSDAANEALARISLSQPLEVDLTVGANRVSHGLGRTPLGVLVVPQSADASFGWSYDWNQPGNPIPQRSAVIDVVGVAMRARVFFL